MFHFSVSVCIYTCIFVRAYVHLSVFVYIGAFYSHPLSVILTTLCIYKGFISYHKCLVYSYDTGACKNSSTTFLTTLSYVNIISISIWSRMFLARTKLTKRWVSMVREMAWRLGGDTPVPGPVMSLLDTQRHFSSSVVGEIVKVIKYSGSCLLYCKCPHWQ